MNTVTFLIDQDNSQYMRKNVMLVILFSITAISRFPWKLRKSMFFLACQKYTILYFVASVAGIVNFYFTKYRSCLKHKF